MQTTPVPAATVGLATVGPVATLADPGRVVSAVNPVRADPEALAAGPAQAAQASVDPVPVALVMAGLAALADPAQGLQVSVDPVATPADPAQVVRGPEDSPVDPDMADLVASVGPADMAALPARVVPVAAMVLDLATEPPVASVAVQAMAHPHNIRAVQPPEVIRIPPFHAAMHPHRAAG